MLLQTLARAGMATGTAGSQLEQLAPCQSGRLNAMCQGHSLPFSRSGESPEVPDCGLCLSSFALCQQLVAIMALLNSLLQKRI